MRDIPLNSFSHDWFGAIVPDAPLWGLAINNGNLILRGASRKPPICIQRDMEGSFVEGLWEGDAAELFLHNPKTGFYFEFNLSPRGAWWCCGFDAPRKRSAAAPKPLSGAITFSVPSETAWDSALAVPIKSLPPELAFDVNVTSVNIAFCLGRPQLYFSLADLGGGQPDFHRPDKWPLLGSLLKMPG
jgi:hypothetical protein